MQLSLMEIAKVLRLSALPRALHDVSSIPISNKKSEAIINITLQNEAIHIL
jgi:hypothetical protein